MDTIFKYVAAVFGVLLVAANIWVVILRKDVTALTNAINEQKAIVALKDSQINAFGSAIDRQNTAIGKLSIDTNSSLEEIKKASGTIEHRYDTVNVEVKDKTCEAKLQVYENLLKAFPWKK